MKFFIALFCAFVMVAIASHAQPSLRSEQSMRQTQTETSIFTPIKQQITKWSITINREIPKRMKKLKNDPSIAVVFASALAAFLYGILHTLGPGHGKMVVASYFLSNGANITRGAWVGSQVALSHVGGAIIIVLATNIALKQVLTNPEAQVFWVKGVSYGLIIAIGLFMAFQATRKLAHKHENIHTCGHCAQHHHHHKSKKEALLSWAIGAVPCTGSLLILVYAMAYDVLWLGLFMVICIALGMALTMTIIGIICISGKKKVIDRISADKKDSKLQPTIELIGALAILFIGSVLLSSLLGK